MKVTSSLVLPCVHVLQNALDSMCSSDLLVAPLRRSVHKRLNPYLATSTFITATILVLFHLRSLVDSCQPVQHQLPGKQAH